VQAGQTRLVTLKLDNEKRPRTAVVREVQREPRTGELLHIDFYQVKMAEKVRIEVPIILVGESPALKFKETILVQELNTLTVECLPAKIPNTVELDLGSLTEPEQAVRVKDMKLDNEITVLNDPELVVASISSQPAEEIQAPVAAEAPAVVTPEATPPREEESQEE
jgi:large subunit ribosomal protein L25